MLILLLGSLWVGHGSYPEIWKLKDDIATQKSQNEIQEDKNRQIQSELEESRTGNAAVEERARSELGMIKKGETFYEIVLKPDNPKKSAAKVNELKDDLTAVQEKK